MVLGFLITENNINSIRALVSKLDNIDVICALNDCEKLIDGNDIIETRFLDDVLALYDILRDECARRIAINCCKCSAVVEYLTSFEK